MSTDLAARASGGALTGDPERSIAESRATKPHERLRVVLCGSFRREPRQLRTTFAELQSVFEVLSPISVDFVNPDDAFVRLAHERHEPEASVEQRHLDALTEADFVWLHCPNGYLGISAAFELGHAVSLGIPIFTDTAPTETVYRSWVTVVESPADVELPQDLKQPGSGLRALQHYYERAAARRGWSGESPQDTLLLMTEEMGELARAVRKMTGLARDGDWDGQDVAEELADIQLYTVHLATSLGIDLASAVTAKERVNAKRVADRASDVA